jgi:DNA-directed RNA polymerase beta' subunit
MSLYRELAQDHEIDAVKGIQFSIMGPDEIRTRSVCEVTAAELYQGLEPVVNGLFDMRMGVIDHNHRCQTCHQRNTMCPGHMGHIVMSKPVFFVQYFEVVRKLLRCVCFRCSKLLVDVERPEIKNFLSKKHARQKRWEFMSRHTSQKIARCGTQTLDGCGAKQPNRITRDGVLRVAMEWTDLDGAGGSKKIVMSAEDVLRILRRISDADADALGFSPKLCRPEWLVCTVLPVLPPSARPSVRNEAGQRCEDDLTHGLLSIIKANAGIKTKMEKGAPKDQIDIMVNVLQSCVAALIDNNVGGLLQMKQQRTGRLLRALFDRLCGKEGRIRGNLMGKRVDFSARSVITPDPNISIDELGVPLRIAMTITFPEVVNPLNREKLLKMVDAGPNVYPGARMVRKTNEKRVVILSKIADRAAIELEDGDVVDRHLMNGDYVLFNRQPSLHKMSMMGHRVRVMPKTDYATFRLNTCVTPVFNADFDGDEMNMHVPQSSQTHEELVQLAAVPKQIVSPRLSTPLIAIVQDVAVGVFKITQNHVRINEKSMMNLLAANPFGIGELPRSDIQGMHGERLWTGRDVMSTIIPECVNVRMENKAYDNNPIDDNIVVIRNGKLIQGVCDVDTYKKTTAGLVHTIFNERGPEETRIFFDNTQKLICEWLLQYGFSVGISDLVIDRDTLAAIKKTIMETKEEVYKIVWDVHAGRFENLSTKNNAAHFESTVHSKLNKTINTVGKLGSKRVAGTGNRMLDMIGSGAKGSLVNFAQMVGCLGQQSVDGKRIPYGFEHRTLPHYAKYDDSPEARGFVVNSFVSGLTPQEFFFHAMGGREGLIDTAVKSVTGDTPIVIIENGVSKRVLIGDWIDNKLDKGDRSLVKVYPEDRNLELLDLPNDSVYIPTCDEKGKVTWGEMTAVTRHDPGNALYKVTTLSGRSVTVAASQSLIVWDEERNGFFPKPSPEVREGEFIPSTARLPEPPIITDSVDMTQYFPKTEYIYGTDFNKAVRMMEDIMNSPTTAQKDGCVNAKPRVKIPAGWWQAHNGQDFVLPYPKKSLLTRVLGRSEVENIKDGCFYPYGASRKAARLPDTFPLNYENGVFIGLYLADGCTHEQSGTVSISKEDPAVIKWVQNWFSKYNIKSRVDRCQKKRGISTATIGNSTLLAKFLDVFVGYGAQNKFVPDVAFTAPECFIKGLLGGYFSGDGSIGLHKYASITVSSTSERMLMGIALLCNRLGIFGSLRCTQQKTTNLDMNVEDILPLHTLSIRGQHARLFQSEIRLIQIYKQERLDNLVPVLELRNYEESVDVMKDAIKSIQVLGVEDHPKLYDVTVPTTLNFMIDNGMVLADTSESGYIQRKLVKAMEDCKVCHDYTVRDTSGSIVQFLFGEDGIDPIKRENQKLPFVRQSLEDMMAEHCFEGPEDLKHHVTKEVYGRLLKDDKWIQRTYDNFAALREDRLYMIHKVFKGRAHEDRISYPIAFQRIIENTRSRFGLYGGDVASDMHPDEVLDGIESLMSELYVTKANPGNNFLKMLLRFHLSPKRVITKYRFCRAAFDYVRGTIRSRFYEALSNPGEMVGVVAAQSIGEPTTQLSFPKSQTIIVKQPDGNIFRGTIGDLIDKILDDQKRNIVTIGQDSVVLPLAQDYYIIGVSNDETTSWKRISEVSRHPANGGLVKVYTKSGKSTCATLSHSFLKRTTNGIEPVKGENLKKGDRIPLAKKIPFLDNLIQEVRLDDGTVLALDHHFGWICGAFLADGWINSNAVKISKKIPEFYEKIRAFAEKLGCTMRQTPHENSGIQNSFIHRGLAKFLEREFKCGSFKKLIPGFVFQAPREFVAGVIGGYFDGDGNVNAIPGKQLIRSASVSKPLTEGMVQLLSFFDIFASINVNHKNNMLKDGVTKQSDQYCCLISRKYAKAYREHIGFVVEHKSQSLDEIIDYVDREGAHDVSEEIDKIPELGSVIARIGEALGYPQQSRTFKRWTKKESIGRRTLEVYIKQFEDTIHALTNSQDLMNVLEDKSSSQDAKEQAVKTFDDRLGYQPSKNPVGPLRMLSYAQKVRNAIQKLPTVQEDLAILRQAAESDIVWDEIIDLEYLPDPQEHVYDFTVPGNDSFMVDCNVLVHNTLNSVHYDEELLILRNGSKLDRVKIGELIDDLVEKSEATDLEEHPNDTKLAWINKPDSDKTIHDIKVLSCDEDGRIDWQTVEAVTRHPVVNEDGSNTLIEVTTHSGRHCIATKGKSFLKRVDNKIIGVEGKDLKVGDYLPVSAILPTREVAAMDVLDLSEHLPKTEWLFMSEVTRALKHRKEADDKGERVWWKGPKGPKPTLELPYNRMDSFLVAFLGSPSRPPTMKDLTKDGCVYSIYNCGHQETSAHIPEKIPLDREWGWIVGAYLSEGCIATGANKKGAVPKPYALLISNNCDDFNSRTSEFCQRYSLGYHVDEGTRDMPSGTVAKTKTLRIHSLLLGTLFKKLFGQGADKKRVHPSLLGAPDEFLIGLLDGYISGDGYVAAHSMNAYSVSEGLLKDLQQILTRFSIPSRVSRMSDNAYETLLKRQPNAKQGWTLYLSASAMKKFSQLVELTIPSKQEVLIQSDSNLSHPAYDVIPDIHLSTGVVALHRNNFNDMRKLVTNEDDIKVLNKIAEEDIMYDQITKISEVSNSKPWVYDLTVANTRTFNLYDGSTKYDTFHQSGYSEGSVQVRGVPRLQELLNVSKNIKTPIMTVRIIPEFCQDKTKCKEIMNTIQTTRLSDLVKSTSIYYDPQDTAIADDTDFVKIYDEWRAIHPELCPRSAATPWVLRMEFDRSKMLDKDVTMLDVERILTEQLDDVSCIFSDDNAKQLVCRMRIVDADGQIDDMLTHLRALEQVLMETTTIKGTPKVNRASMYKKDTDKDEDRGKPDNKGADRHDIEEDVIHKTYEWIIETDGTNLKEILAHPFVDGKRTLTNDVYEIWQTLGIEAARQALHDEIMEVLKTAYVNYCHISLLIDTMTHKGHLTSVSRHGINRSDTSVLQKASFEMTKDVIVKAGVFAEYDRMNGITANIMLGQIGQFGTGLSDVLVDPSMLYEQRPWAKVEKKIVGMEDLGVDLSDVAGPSSGIKESAQATADMFKMEIDLEA